MSDNEVVLGIDLGTTYSVVSIFQNNNPKVIQDEIGNKIIPSFIAFENDKKMLVGEDAKSLLGIKGTAVIYDAKRLIGRTCDDPNVLNDKKNWPFIVKSDPKTNKPIIVINPKKKIIKKELDDIDSKNYHKNDINYDDKNFFIIIFH